MQDLATLNMANAYRGLAQTVPSANNLARGSSSDQVKAKAHETATEFEGVFLSLMLKEMFAGIKSEGDFTGGFGEEMFRDMMTEQYAQTISDTGGIGLADSIYREILALQEVSD